jgi:hypothetical protein
MSKEVWTQFVLAVKCLLRGNHPRIQPRIRFPLLALLEDRVLLAANSIAVNDVYSVPEGNSFSGPSVLINDTDPGGTLDLATLQSGISHGSLRAQFSRISLQVSISAMPASRPH